MKAGVVFIFIAIMSTTGAFAQTATSSDGTSLSPSEKADALAIWERLTDQQKRFLAARLPKKPKEYATGSAPTLRKAVDAVVAQPPARLGAPPTVSPDTPVDCSSQRLFVRRDRFDVFTFLNPCGPTDELGASVSATNNQLAGTANVTIQGWTGYVVTPSDANYAIGPSIYANGALADPFKEKTERSAIRGAIENEFFGPEYTFKNSSLAPNDPPLALSSFLDIAPYVQTDFRDIGRIAGIDAIFEPYIAGLHLGGRDDINKPELVGIYWRVEPEMDLLHVETPGLTNFAANSNHEFFGGTLRANMILFQNMPEVGEALCGRVYVTGTGQYFGDAQGKAVSNYSAEIGYYLGSGVAPFWRSCAPRAPGGPLPTPTASATSSSISFVFSNGTDKTTLVDQRQYKVQLNYKY